jgi:hypothetical protein
VTRKELEAKWYEAMTLAINSGEALAGPIIFEVMWKEYDRVQKQLAAVTEELKMFEARWVDLQIQEQNRGSDK